uniref:Putative monolaris n=1 Tax=Amblyomma parvum TaxID=251391 RepID=A0A023FYQ2_AMBPA
MQPLTLFALLCLMGTTLSARPPETRCLEPVRNPKGMCNDGGTYTKRFGYDPITQKCKEFLEFSCTRNNNSFNNYTTCMQVCNPNSKCLITPTKPMGKWFRTSFVFNITTLKCIKTTSFFKPSTGADYNRFLKEEECNKTCVPELQEIITSYG